MNETGFKRHLKDLAHGHHHPDEHDWDRSKPKAHPPKTAPARKKTSARKGREK